MIQKSSMGPGTGGSTRYCTNVVAVVAVIYAVLASITQVQCGEDASAREISSNRVLPVDAEHQTKISTPLEPSCVQSIRENLVKFLKRHPHRQGRQDDGDDGDDGDGDGGGIGGILSGLGEGNGALSTLSMIPQVLPQLVSTLTQLSGAVNQGLNGTDTPNIPSFLVAQGMQAIKLFQAIAGASQQANRGGGPMEVHVQRIPGSGPPPMRKPRPPGNNYESYPSPGASAAEVNNGAGGTLQGGLELEDYLDEDVKQPLQPTLAPLVRPVNGGGGGGAYDNNPFLQNADLLDNQGTGGNPAAEGLPQGTSLWNIYKSFSTRPDAMSGALSDFQLAHPEAFSNELLQSISQAISSIRGQMGQHAPAVATDRPSSEIFKQVYNSTEVAPPPPPSIFLGGNRPTLSVYKPSGSISGVGIDLSNLALNHSQTVLNAVKEPGKEVEEPTSEEEETTPQPQHEVEVAPGGASGAAATLEKLQAQNFKEVPRKPGGPQFVKSPTSSHLTLAQGQYVPAVTTLHETDEVLREVGPLLSTEDRMNGFNNRAPFKPILNGILLEAPKLTPAPLQNFKRPTGLVINTDGDRDKEDRPQFTTPFPSFHFQVKQQPGLPPNFHGPDPTTQRAHTLVASIPNKFEYENNPPIKASSGLVPSTLFAQPTDAVPQSTWGREPEPSPSHQDIQPAYVPFPRPTPAPQPPPQRAPPPQPTQQLTQPQANAQRILQQLLALQAILQRQQQQRFQQNVEKLQTVYDHSLTTTVPTTTTPPPPPPPKIVILPPIPPLNQFVPPPGYIQVGDVNNGPLPPQKGGSSAIANGFANAIANNLAPGSTLINNNRPHFVNGQPAATFVNPPPVNGASPPNENSNNVFNTVPIRTTTKTPNVTAASTTPSTVRIEQFPSYVKQPSPYFPNAGNTPQEVNEDTAAPEKNVGSGQTIPGVVQTKNPTLSNLFNNNNPSQLPQTTARPIAGAFSPYHPFGGFAIHLEDTSTPAPAQKATVSPPVSTTTAASTTTTKATSTTAPPLSSFNFVRPSGGYYPSAGLPVTSGQAASSPSGTPPPLPPPAPPRTKPRPQVSDPYSIINNPHFQLPAQSGGYPQFVPKTPTLVTSSGLKTPSQNSNSTVVPGAVNATATQTVSFAVSTSPPLLLSGDVLSSVAQQLEASSPPPKLASAISEMAKLPFYQEDAFRPSVIPPNLLGIISTSENPEDSGESQAETQTEKPFEELFSAASNVSSLSTTTLEPLVTDKVNFSEVDENDSAEEQAYPNFPPGKPIYWMNMFYPNGVPVLTRVKTTPEPSTTPKPRRRRTRSTTTSLPTTTISPEPEYYEDDDVGAEHKAKKKRRKTTTTMGTTEADFSS